ARSAFASPCRMAVSNCPSPRTPFRASCARRNCTSAGTPNARERSGNSLRANRPLRRANNAPSQRSFAHSHCRGPSPPVCRGMKGYFLLVLHAHLPFVRHPEHEKFLEENWLFEAITESYLPLLQLLGRWRKDQVRARLTLTLTPTLRSMLLDPLLQDRYERHLNHLIALVEKELVRTQWERPFHELARFYHGRLEETRSQYRALERNLVAAFRASQQLGQIEIATS